MLVSNNFGISKIKCLGQNMKKKIVKIIKVITVISVVAGAIAFIFERIDEIKAKKRKVKKMSELRHKGFYERFIKRPLDATLAMGGIIVLSPLYLIIALLVRKNLGSPVIFTQPRPGKDEEVFNLYKFRSMTDEKDADGKLLPDSERLPKFGRILRSTSLDELPELFNILKGEMALIGPRPQLVKDMVFMDDEQRKRHSVRAGLTGLAQVSGRNAITWEKKLKIDIEYVKNLSLKNDFNIFLKTIKGVLCQEDISEEGIDTATDYGDYLLNTNQITEDCYRQGQMEAEVLLNE